MDSLLFTQILEAGQSCVRIEMEAVKGLFAYINEDFARCVYAIWQGKGRAVLTGVGKSAIIAQKIAATFNSTGTPALFMHAADALHGDLGMVQPPDVVICLSKSGETPEIKTLIPIIKSRGNVLVAMVGNPSSFLANRADYILNTEITREACPHNLAPTASTIAQMAMGDALAMSILQLRGFSAQDFGQFHPGGMLGKQMFLQVENIYTQNNRPSVSLNASIRQVIVEISAHRLGATAVLDADNSLLGIITDGDLRRAFGTYEALDQLCAANLMTPTPRVISADALAKDALNMMQTHKVSQLIVMKNEQYAGMIHLHDLLREGFS